MSRTPDQLLIEALDLAPEDRAQLAQSLISSLDEGADDVDPAELERAWRAEVAARAADIDAGTVTTRPAAEVFSAAREELLAMRTRHA